MGCAGPPLNTPGDSSKKTRDDALRPHNVAALESATDIWAAREHAVIPKPKIRERSNSPHRTQHNLYRDAVRDAILANDRARVEELAKQDEILEQPSGFAVFHVENDAIKVERR